MVCMHSKFK